MTPNVVAVKALPDFMLEAEFADSEIRRLDIRPLLAYPACACLREGGLFISAKVENATVFWNEETDLSPDTLYLRGVVAQRGHTGAASG